VVEVVQDMNDKNPLQACQQHDPTQQPVNNVAAIVIAVRQRIELEDNSYQHTPKMKRLAVQCDHMGPVPFSKDLQFERFFHITRTHAKYLLHVCCTHDKFFLESVDALKRKSICPKAKLLMALRCVAYIVPFLIIFKWDIVLVENALYSVAAL
jgi:hypothetical protein